MPTALPQVPYPNAIEARPTLRQSLLSDFDNCALTTKFGLDYRQGWDSHPQGRGKLFHEFAAKALREMARLGEQRIETDVALAILHEVLRQEHADDVCHQPGCNRLAIVIPPDERGEDGRSLICEAGHRHHSDVVNVPMREIKDLYWVVKKWAFDNEFDTSHLIDTERRLEVVVQYPNPAGGSVERTLTGQVDAMFLDAEDPAHMVLLDWKDTWGLPAPTEVSFEGYFQQRFYALLVMRNFPSIERVTLREFYVRFSEPREASVSREALSDIEEELSALAERFDRAYEQDIWKPTPGRHCNFCPRPSACPIPVFSRGEGRIIDPERAAQVGAQLLVAEVVVKQNREALKAYVSQHGPVPVKDAKGRTEWGFQMRTYESKPNGDEVRAFMETGGDPSKLFVKKNSTRFSRYTVKPGEASKALPASASWVEPGEPDEAMIAALEQSVRDAEAKRNG